MNYQWILLAFFLVAVISGTMKALKRDMLRNLLRLGSVVVAFLITFFLQMGGAFQGIVVSIAEALDLAAMMADFAFATDLVIALVGTVVSAIVFVPVFFLVMGILRIIIFVVLKIVAKKADKAPVAVSEEAQEPEKTDAVEEKADAVEEKADAVEANAAAEVENDTDAAELTEKAEEKEAAEGEEKTDAAAKAEEEAPADAEPEEKHKKKKPIFYKEKAWKRAISVAAGIIGGILTLSVTLLPVFYTMSLVSTAAHAAENTDASDSQIYQMAEVVDTYIVAPYEDSFVGGFYDVFGLSDLMCYTAKLGGKIELDNGTVAYADDTVKSILSHGLSAASQITSQNSECATVKEDINAIITDPALSSIVSDLLMGYIADMEIEEPAEDDLMGGLLNNFMTYYKEADKATIEKDLAALGNTIGVLAEKGVVAKLLEEDADFEELLADEEMLGDVVSAISGLSAFGPTIEGAFELGIGILGDTLQIPEDDAVAYENFMDDLLTQMQKSSSTAFNMNTIRYFIVKCEERNVRVASNNGVSGYSQFNAYVTHWKRVQSAFAHASEDQSYGYFTIEINGKWYLYDESAKKIVIYSAENEATYKDKISPVAGIINALTQRSTTKRLTKENVYTILNAYVASANDQVSVALANRILDKDNFVSKAATVEKMLAATDFTDWTDEEKAIDSKLCVSIIMKLLTLMDNLGNLNYAEDLDIAIDMLDQFTLLGETMDMMKETSCIKDLPPLLIEGIVKNEVFADFMKPSIAFQINSIVENNNRTYAECMNQIAGIISWAINSFGSTMGG